MAYVIAEPCIGTKDNSCVEVCPVDCIHPTPDEPDYDKVEMLYIDPEECIDCDACVEACPVDACFAEDQLPDEWQRLRADQRASTTRAAEGAPASSRRRPSAAIGSDMPAGAAAGAAGAAACSTGSSTGNIAIRPRATWRMRLRGRVVGVGDDERHAGVGLLAQRHRQRHLAEQRHVELVGQLLAAALAEDREALAATGVTKPVMFSITPAISRSTLCGHLGGAARDLLRGRLRRRDDHELRLRQQLGERHRDVAGAGRQVDEQEVELAPVDVLEELRERLVEHRPAPDDGGVLLDEEADRHDLHAVGLQRDDLALGRDRRAAAPTPNMRGIE